MNIKTALKSAAVSLALALVTIPAVQADDSDTDEQEDAAVLSEDGSVIETNMDDIELALIGKYYERNRKFLYEMPEGLMHA